VGSFFHSGNAFSRIIDVLLAQHVVQFYTNYMNDKDGKICEEW
jgi:hypothetical protein